MDETRLAGLREDLAVLPAARDDADRSDGGLRQKLKEKGLTKLKQCS